jgi:hypothetical protein
MEANQVNSFFGKCFLKLNLKVKILTSVLLKLYNDCLLLDFWEPGPIQKWLQKVLPAD